MCEFAEEVTDDAHECIVLTYFLHSRKFSDHLHTHTQENESVAFQFNPCLIPIPLTIQTHCTQHDLTHLETVSLVHQKPLPLGGEMHLLCILWSHTIERTLKYSPLLQTLTFIPPNTHKRCSYLRHQWVEVCIVLLCNSICVETHTTTVNIY